MSSWDKRWMEMAELVASWSKDRSKQVGCVIVDDRNTVVSLGWNGLCRGVSDAPDLVQRHEKPHKYMWYEHAERNAIYNAASTGQNLRNCTLYSTCFLCADCTRAVIQSGITQVVTPKPDMDSSWAEHFHVAFRMLTEAGVAVTYVDTESKK